MNADYGLIIMQCLGWLLVGTALVLVLMRIADAWVNDKWAGVVCAAEGDENKLDKLFRYFFFVCVFGALAVFAVLSI